MQVLNNGGDGEGGGGGVKKSNEFTFPAGGGQVNHIGKTSQRFFI
jgi:hypothetical protein